MHGLSVADAARTGRACPIEQELIRGREEHSRSARRPVGLPTRSCCFRAWGRGRDDCDGAWPGFSAVCLPRCLPSLARADGHAGRVRGCGRDLGCPIDDQLASRPGWVGIVLHPYPARCQLVGPLVTGGTLAADQSLVTGCYLPSVGKASQKKKQVQAQRRDRPQLIRKVREQVSLLRLLGGTFDQGERVAGYPLATVIRVIVHETSRSHALLAQVGELGKMLFVDTSVPINPDNLLRSHGGLVLLKMMPGVGSEWVPRKEVPPVPVALPRDVPFSVWWNTDVMNDGHGTLWSRRKMVLTIANEEGGSHVDPAQPVDVRAIEDENSMGWKFHDPIIGDVSMARGPLMPSVRQIAYELEESITKRLASELSQ